MTVHSHEFTFDGRRCAAQIVVSPAGLRLVKILSEYGRIDPKCAGYPRMVAYLQAMLPAVWQEAA